MKITFLGTAAAEGCPAVFCNCDYCREARSLGGKNIRTRSQAIINDDLLLDLPADTYSHFLTNNIEGHKINYIFITHAHADHCYPMELHNTCRPFVSHDTGGKKLTVYSSAGAFKNIENTIKWPDYPLLCKVLKPFEVTELGDYTVTALPARHSTVEDGALIYIIEGEKKILYAHDTGFFYDEVFDYIKQKGFVFDLVSLDCTNIDIPASDTSSHMSIDCLTRVLQKLAEFGAVTENTKKVINHFSHNAGPIHHKLEERVSPLGYIVSYDGLCIEI